MWTQKGRETNCKSCKNEDVYILNEKKYHGSERKKYPSPQLLVRSQQAEA